MPLNFLMSQRKKKQLTIDGYIFTRVKEVGGIVIWRCFEAQKHKCNSRARTSSSDETGVLLSVSKHNHAGNSARVAARRLIEEIKSSFKQSDEPAKKILTAALQTASESLEPATPTTQVIGSNQNETQNVELFPSISHNQINIASPSPSTSQDRIRNKNDNHHNESETCTKNDDAQLQKTATIIELSRDEYQVFGDYIASEFRTLKSENSRILLRRKIQSAILDVAEIDASAGISSVSSVREPQSPQDGQRLGTYIELDSTPEHSPTQSLQLCKEEVSENDIKYETENV